MSGMCRRLGMSAAAPSCSCPPTACALEMPSPSSWPDTPAQEHADTVREALNFGYGGDPNYRPFYEDGITALDALLKEVERLTAERDEAVMKKARMDNWGYSDRGLQARAEAAEREVERLTAEIAEQKQAWWDQRNDWVVATKTNQEIIDKAVARAEAAEALAERRGEALRDNNVWIESCIAIGGMPPEGAVARIQANRAALADGGQDAADDGAAPRRGGGRMTNPRIQTIREALDQLKGILRVYVLPADDALDGLAADLEAAREALERIDAFENANREKGKCAAIASEALARLSAGKEGT